MLTVFADAGATVAGLAERVAVEAGAAVAARGEFRLGLSGGETPVALYRLLASAVWRDRIDWTCVVLLLADERAVPVGDAERTDRLLRDTLVAPLKIAPERLRSMGAEASDLEAAALEYESELERPIDLLLLGEGGDGHIASLFPGSLATVERVRRVVAVYDSPKPPRRRLTLTPRAIGEARVTCMLVTGAAKADAVAVALRPGTNPAHCPAALVAGGDWYVDAAAASKLE